MAEPRREQAVAGARLPRPPGRIPRPVRWLMSLCGYALTLGMLVIGVPPVLEGTFGGACAALEARASSRPATPARSRTPAEMLERTDALRRTFGTRDGEMAPGDFAAARMRERYPALPASLSCSITYLIGRLLPGMFEGGRFAPPAAPGR